MLNNKEDEEEVDLDSLGSFHKIDSDAQKSYNAIAQMMNFQHML